MPAAREAGGGLGGGASGVTVNGGAGVAILPAEPLVAEFAPSWSALALVLVAKGFPVLEEVSGEPFVEGATRPPLGAGAGAIEDVAPVAAAQILVVAGLEGVFGKPRMCCSSLETALKAACLLEETWGFWGGRMTPRSR